jgi:hypothetical protein
MKKQIWQEIREDMEVETQEEKFVKLSGMEMLCMDDNIIPLGQYQIKRPLGTLRRRDQERDRHTEAEDTVYKNQLSKDKGI